MTKHAPEEDSARGHTLFSTLNNVFFVIVLVAMAVGGAFVVVNKL